MEKKETDMQKTAVEELSSVVRAHVDTFHKANAAQEKKTTDPNTIPEEIYDLAGDVTKAIASAKGVQADPVQAKAMVEKIIQKEVFSRMDLPGPVMGVLQNILFHTLPRLIGEGAKRWFKKMDTDGDGRVSRQEFAAGATASLCCCCASCPNGKAAAEACCGFLFPCVSCCCRD